MKVYKIVPASGEGLPFIFGGDSAYVSVWPKNPDGQDLLLLFTIDCEVATRRLNRSDLPSDGFLHVFSTYDPDGYFLDLITADEVRLNRGEASYTYVACSDSKELIKSPRPAIPLQYADFEEASIGEEELTVSSLVSLSEPMGAIIPPALLKDFNFLGQVYSSDFPSPFEDVLYMSDGVGYLLVSKQSSAESVDGCFFVQVG